MWPEDHGRASVVGMGRATLEVFNEKQAQTVDQIEVAAAFSGRVRFALQVPDLNGAVQWTRRCDVASAALTAASSQHLPLCAQTPL